VNIRQPAKDENRVPFGTIKPGETFYIGTILCMKTLNEGHNKDGKILNAVDLTTGELLVFDNEIDKVAPAEAHVVLGR